MAERYTATLKGLTARRAALARERAAALDTARIAVEQIDTRLAALDRVLGILRQNQATLEPLLDELIAAGVKVGG